MIPGWPLLAGHPGASEHSLTGSLLLQLCFQAGRGRRTNQGLCTLDDKAFRYRSENEDFTIPLEKLPALAFSCAEEFELYHGGELHYFYPLEEPRQCARWALAVDLAAERRKKEGERSDGKA